MFLWRKRISADFLPIVCKCIAVEFSNYQDERVGIPFTGLPRSMFVSVLSQNQEFQRYTCTLWSVVVFSELLWWGVIVRFADICGIIDHHCLSFLFIFIDNYRHDVYYWQTLSHKNQSEWRQALHLIFI